MAITPNDRNTGDGEFLFVWSVSVFLKHAPKTKKSTTA